MTISLWILKKYITIWSYYWLLVNYLVSWFFLPTSIYLFVPFTRQYLFPTIPLILIIPYNPNLYFFPHWSNLSLKKISTLVPSFFGSFLNYFSHPCYSKQPKWNLVILYFFGRSVVKTCFEGKVNSCICIILYKKKIGY